MVVAILAAGGCIDIDYANTEFACSETEPCPSGFGCAAGRCISGSTSDGGNVVNAASCRELHESTPAAPSGVYRLDPGVDGGQPAFDAYCEMTEDGGGWTLAMKIDGTLQTFAHDAVLWTTPDPLNPDKPDLDRIEAKLPTFSFVPFTQLRVGMDDGGEERWLAVDLEGSSLLDVFDGAFKVTTVGRASWLALLTSGSLQLNCNREGSNNSGRIRLGIVANDGNNCNGTDSFVGLGGDPICGSTTTAGNVACLDAVAGDRDTAVFGTILVR